jgi:mono/diheme cytochrome c family protein
MEWYEAQPDAKAELRGKCTLCHVSQDGTGPLTEFGQSFAEHGYRFTPALRQAYPTLFAGATGAALAAATPAFNAKEFYHNNCLVCHGDDGTGGLGNTPDFTDASWQQGKNDAEMAETIKSGKGLMPPWKEKLDADQVQAMVKLVRQFAQK